MTTNIGSTAPYSSLLHQLRKQAERTDRSSLFDLPSSRRSDLPGRAKQKGPPPRSKRPQRNGGQARELSPPIFGHTPPVRKIILTKTKRPFKPRDNKSRTGHASFDDPELEFGAASILQSFKFPTQAELPKSPIDLVEDPSKHLARALKSLGGREDKSKEDNTLLQEGRTSYHRTQRIFKIPGSEDLLAIGEGRSKAQAAKANSLHALAKLHEAGLLELIWARIEISNKERSDEKQGIMDVFDYAARHRCIPEVSTKVCGSINVVSIEMPEHNISATSKYFGPSEIASIFAVREFKRQAELYQQSQGTGSLVVKDAASLSTSNARQFFDFCKDSNEDVRVSIEINSIANGQGGHTATAILQDDTSCPPSPVVRSVDMAEKLGYLIAALTAGKEKPYLLDDFSRALRAGNGQYLGKHRPFDVMVSPQSLQDMRNLSRLVNQERKWSDNDHQHDGSEETSLRMRRMRALTEIEVARRSALLKQKLEAYRTRPELAQLRQTRSELPMSQFAPQVREIVQNNTYCVIIGATGSGKTTQVPQILLEQAIENGTGAACNIICTQPRRIAATSVAKRVAEERGESLQDTVGHHVRFDAKTPKPGGSILYCTTGILLQQLQHAPDEVFDFVSHLVIDEVHERDMPIDFLLIMLKKTMQARVAQGKKVPQVVLMSATIDAERFANYFKNSLPSGKAADCPTLRVPGRTFPVTERHLEDVVKELEGQYSPADLRLLKLDKPTQQYLDSELEGLKNGVVGRSSSVEDSVIDWKGQKAADGDDVLVDTRDDSLVPLGLAATTTAHVVKSTKDGAILVFLPGLEEITKLDQMLRLDMPLGVDFNNPEQFRIFMLHSSIPDSQKTVFNPVPDDCRKIILSTNIAETSVTIPDVQFVIDSGKSREKMYDQMRRITQLQCTWISKSNAKQRAGRAGRVQNGNYYALYTKPRHESLRAIGLPELLRSDLQEICLDVKSQAFKMPVRQFLAEALEPPSPAAVDAAMRSLTALDALTEDEALTPLGRLLASLPVHPALGKMIVLGIIFRCLDPMIILGAAAHERPLFVRPPGLKREVERVRNRFAGSSSSDHIMLLNAFRSAREATRSSGFRAAEMLGRDFIHHGAFKSISSTAKEIEGILTKAGLIRAHDDIGTPEYGGAMLNENSNSEEMIKALLVAGLHPNVAVGRNDKYLRTSEEKFTFIHPASVNTSNVAKDSLFAYTTLALSTDGHRKNLRETSNVHPLMVLLFGGRISAQKGSLLEMDDWLSFYVKASQREGSGLPVSRPGSEICFFHRALWRMLGAAFADLAKKESLADDTVREKLASGLARILQREAGQSASSAPDYLTRLRDPESSRSTGVAQRAWNSPGQSSSLPKVREYLRDGDDSSRPAPRIGTYFGGRTRRHATGYSWN